jgi:hypothetical protein
MIPTYLERLIHEGKAEHKTFSGAIAENLVLTVPDKSYIIIYEYWFKPLIPNMGALSGAPATTDFADSIQFVNFYNNDGFNAYWHECHFDMVQKTNASFPTTNPVNAGSYLMPSGDHTDYRTVYIKTNRDLSIYFTKLNTDDLGSNIGAVPIIDPLNPFFGYADPLLLITRLISAYQVNSVFPGTPNYEPLQDNITKQVIPAASPDFVNQMFTIPFYGGAFPNAAAYAGAGTSALGKARAHHFQCNYVQVNMENPKNLI